MNIETQERFDYLFKVVIIGDSNVGKTNIISRLVHDKFIKDSKSTIGVGFATKIFKFDGSLIKVQLWDTAGQERYRALVSAYYRGSFGAVIVYDVTDKNSFEHAHTRWIENLESSIGSNIPKMLLGNKIDLVDEVVITKNEGQKEALANEMAFFETSALSGDNINIAFETFIRRIYENEKRKDLSEDKNMLDESKVKIASKLSKPKNRKGCC